MNEQAQVVVDDYMRRLKKELKALPRAQREEILEDINEHVAQALEPNGSAGEEDARRVLDQLGDPAEIAREARERFGIPSSRFGGKEICAVVLLPVAWPIGVLLLWTSHAWTSREKLIGTFVPPGGLSLVSLLAVLSTSSGEVCGGRVNPHTGRVISDTCSGGGSASGDILAWIVLVVVPLLAIAVPIWLGVRAHRRAAA